MSDIERWMKIVTEGTLQKGETVNISRNRGGGVGTFVGYTSDGSKVVLDIKGNQAEFDLDDIEEVITGNEPCEIAQMQQDQFQSVENGHHVLKDKPEMQSGDTVEVEGLYGAGNGRGYGVFVAYSHDGTTCIVNVDGKERSIQQDLVTLAPEGRSEDRFASTGNDGSLSPMSYTNRTEMEKDDDMDSHDSNDLRKLMQTMEMMSDEDHLVKIDHTRRDPSTGLKDTRSRRQEVAETEEEDEKTECECKQYECVDCFPNSNVIGENEIFDEVYSLSDDIFEEDEGYDEDSCDDDDEELEESDKPKPRADKDYDGDGTRESEPDEYAGCRDKAIQKSMKDEAKEEVDEGLGKEEIGYEVADDLEDYAGVKRNAAAQVDSDLDTMIGSGPKYDTVDEKAEGPILKDMARLDDRTVSNQEIASEFSDERDDQTEHNFEPEGKIKANEADRDKVMFVLDDPRDKQARRDEPEPAMHETGEVTGQDDEYDIRPLSMDYNREDQASWGDEENPMDMVRPDVEPENDGMGIPPVDVVDDGMPQVDVVDHGMPQVEVEFDPETQEMLDVLKNLNLLDVAYRDMAMGQAHERDIADREARTDIAVDGMDDMMGNLAVDDMATAEPEMRDAADTVTVGDEMADEMPGEGPTIDFSDLLRDFTASETSEDFDYQTAEKADKFRSEVDEMGSLGALDASYESVQETPTVTEEKGRNSRNRLKESVESNEEQADQDIVDMLNSLKKFK